MADRIVAPNFSAGVETVGTTFEAPLRSSPDEAAVVISTLLHGESFTVFDRTLDWAWGQCGVDGYVGWIAASALAMPMSTATHAITGDALVFSAPSIKAPVVGRLPLNARITAVGEVGSFLNIVLPTGPAWLHRRHVEPVTGDIVDLAQHFLGTPYRWGGRSRDGVDCSGLTQAVFLAHGVACPRDSDQQRAAFAPVEIADRRRGDLAFFPGHVGIMVDAALLLHANAYWMTTLIEPLDAVVGRLSADFDTPLLGIVRPL